MNKLLRIAAALVGITGTAYAGPSSPPAGNYILNVSTLVASPAFNVASGTVRTQLNLGYGTQGNLMWLSPGGILTTTTTVPTGGDVFKGSTQTFTGENTFISSTTLKRQVKIQTTGAGQGQGSGGSILVWATDETGMPIQVYSSSANQAGFFGMVNLINSNTNYANAYLYVSGASSVTGKADAYLTDPNPNIQFVQTGVVSPAGQYEFMVTGDTMQWRSMNAGGSAYKPRIGMTHPGALVFYETTDNGHFVAFKASATISANVTWVLPPADGSANQVLATDGAGNLSWVTQSGGGGGSSPLETMVNTIHLSSPTPTINFIGPGVTGANIGSTATITISSFSQVLVSSGIAFGSATNTVTSDTNTFVRDKDISGTYSIWIGTHPTQGPTASEWFGPYGGGLALWNNVTASKLDIAFAGESLASVNSVQSGYLPFVSYIPTSFTDLVGYRFWISHSTTNVVTINVDQTTVGPTNNGTLSINSALQIPSLTANQCVQTDGSNNLISSGGSCGGGGGGTSGTINAANTYSVGTYSYQGSSNQISGTSDFQYTSASNTLSIQAGTAMTLQGHTTGQFMKDAGFIVAKDHYGYMTASSGNSLNVFDLTNPTAPVLITQITTTTVPAMAGAEGLEISGNYLYIVTLSSNALIVVDISTPGSPTVLSTTIDATNLHGAEHLRILGNYAYIANFNSTAGSEPGLSVWDISNPLSPKYVGGVIDSNILNPTYIQVRYPYLYLTSQNVACNLNIIEISNPTSPVLRKTYVPTGCTNTLATTDFYGKYLYVSANGTGSLYTLDISSPLAPVTISSWTNTSEAFLTVKVLGKSLYMTSPLTHRLFQFSLVTPSSPTFVNLLTDSVNMVQPDDILPYGNFLLTSDHGQGSSAAGGMSIINVGAISVPTMAAGVMMSDEMEVTHDLQAKRIFTDGIQTKVGWIQNQLAVGNVTVSSNSILAGSTFYADGTADLAVRKITWANGTGVQVSSPTGGAGATTPGGVSFNVQIDSAGVMTGVSDFNVNRDSITVGLAHSVNISTNAIIAGTTFYRSGFGFGTVVVPNDFIAGGAQAVTQQMKWDTANGYLGIDKTPAHELDVQGSIYASDHMVSPYYVNAAALKPGFALTGSGSFYGVFENTAPDVWDWGYTSNPVNLGTPVLKFDKSPAVNILSSVTVINTSASQKWIQSLSTSAAGPYAMAVSTTNHLNFQDQQSSPTITSCGTGPSIIGNDNVFQITAGVSATGCVATFAKPYKVNVPICLAVNETVSVINAFSYVTTLTDITMTQTGLAGNKIDVHCFGRDP